MTSTLTEKAVVGRRIMFTYYRDLEKPAPPEHPGVITELVPDQGASVRLRLDGKRSSLHVPPDYQGLRYLDEVGPVPGLPMGRFTPTADDFGGDWEGVPVFQCESEDIVILTGDQLRAAVALHAFCQDMGIDREFLPAMQARWAVFEWEPEDADYPWTVRWDAVQGDDQAIRIHYLPA
jgi:hypothetical protein